MSFLGLLQNEKRIQSFNAGDIIFREGDKGDYMCAVLDGEVNINKWGLVIETVLPGNVFGELSLIDAQPRNATAIAKTPCRLAIIDARRFAILVKKEPYFSLEVMRVMSDRLRTVMNPPPED